MDRATVIPLELKASIILTVFALGIDASVDDLLFVLRRPAYLLRSLLAMNVIMPLVAAWVAATFAPGPAVKIALVALALSPIPPLLPRRQIRAGGNTSYAFGLLVAAGLIAIAFVPFALEAIERALSVPLHMSRGQVARIFMGSVLAPLVAGLLLRRVTPTFAKRISRPLSVVATLLLLAAFVPIVVIAWPAIGSLVRDGTLVAFGAFIVIGLAVGHVLGGPEPEDRTVLALAAATRHPGIALAIAGANFSDQKLVLPAVLLYMIASAVLSLPYSIWRAKHRTHAVAGDGHS